MDPELEVGARGALAVLGRAVIGVTMESEAVLKAKGAEESRLKVDCLGRKRC